MSTSKQSGRRHTTESASPSAAGPMATSSFSKLSENFRSLTPLDFQCRFCGGKKCKYEGPANWNKSQMAIEGIYSNWITPNILAMARPNTEVIEKYNVIDQFKKNGIKSIMNLQQPGEHRHCGNGLEISGFSYNPDVFMENEIYFYNYGCKDYGALPMETMLDVVKVIDFSLRQGKIAVHCHAGLGRTGVIIACFLIYLGRIPAEDSITYVRSKRPKSIQTRSQITCVRNFATFILPKFIIFSSVVKSRMKEELTIGQCLSNQSIILHGYEARDLKYLPKVIFVICEKLLLLSKCQPIGKKYQEEPVDNPELDPEEEGAIRPFWSSFLSVQPLSHLEDLQAKESWPNIIEDITVTQSKGSEKPKKSINIPTMDLDTTVWKRNTTPVDDNETEGRDVLGEPRRQQMVSLQKSFSRTRNARVFASVSRNQSEKVSEEDVSETDVLSSTELPELDSAPRAYQSAAWDDFPNEIAQNIPVHSRRSEAIPELRPRVTQKPNPAPASHPTPVHSSTGRDDVTLRKLRGSRRLSHSYSAEMIALEMKTLVRTPLPSSAMVEGQIDDGPSTPPPDSQSLRAALSTTEVRYPVSVSTEQLQRLPQVEAHINRLFGADSKHSSFNNNPQNKQTGIKEGVITFKTTAVQIVDTFLKTGLEHLPRFKLSVAEQIMEKINGNPDGWFDLERLSDISILISLLLHWLESLKEPVLSSQEITRLTDVADLDVTYALQRLDRSTRITIEYLYRFVVNLQPVPEDEKLKMMYRLLEALLQQDLLDEEDFTERYYEMFSNTIACQEISKRWEAFSSLIGHCKYRKANPFDLRLQVMVRTTLLIGWLHRRRRREEL